MPKLLTSYLSYQFSRLLGGRKYSDWAKQTLELQKNIPIKNKKLAEELEAACEKNHAALPFSQYLAIDQFGTNGYHYTHKENGMTDTPERWPKPIVRICKKYGLHAIVEFGPGNGELGIRTLKEVQKENYPLSWSGVEINSHLQQETRKRFVKNKLRIDQLVTTLEALRLKDPCLFIFSYSLDNIPPEIFINTNDTICPPNAMVGITVKNGLLSEVILEKRVLSKTFDLSGWKLAPYQRLYLSPHSLEIFLQAFALIPKGSRILIIDEFATKQLATSVHVNIPKNLEKFQRYETDLQSFYDNAGKNLLYFPLHLEAFLSALDGLKLPYSFDSERRFLKTLAGEKSPPDKNWLTHAFIIKKENELYPTYPLRYYPNTKQ